MVKILLIGNGAREHALAEAVMRSNRKPGLVAFMKATNPGIAALAETVRVGNYGDLGAIRAFARESKVDLALIGPEDPLLHGVVDALSAEGIPSVGPAKSLARLETSKSFTRNLLTKYHIPGNIRYRTFTSMEEIPSYLSSLPEVVIKPDGLTGGKGVLVQGEHFMTPAEALEACRRILSQHNRLIIEEKLDGEEFSLQCFCDGQHIVAMPAVQDHKRRFEDDTGPNTGGMGSYSAADHSLPFLRGGEIKAALEITRQVASALYQETGGYYRGIMYGGFMVTAEGLRLLEYNARFGDPEAMNVLPLLKTDFIDICEAIVSGTLHGLSVTWENKATVCKYLVPKNYGLEPDHPAAVAQETDMRITIGDPGRARLYFSSVDQRDDGLYLTSSRAVGVVGIADSIDEAQETAEAGTGTLTGCLDHRRDIGTTRLLEKRIRHMDSLRGHTPGGK